MPTATLPTTHETVKMEDISWRVILTASFFLVLCPLFVAGRVWALWHLEIREHGKGAAKIQADGWWLIATLPLAFVGMSFIIAGAKMGVGKHVSDVLTLPNGTKQLSTALFLFFIDSILYAVIMGMTKIAILYFYIRTFSPHKHFKNVCKVFIYVIAAFTVASATVDIIGCSPIDLAWNGTPEEQDKYCVDFDAYWYTRTVFNVVTDAVIAVLPLPIVAQLQMSWWKRFKVSSMFLLGFFVVAIATVRATTIKSAGMRDDPTWNGAMFCVYSVIEDGVGIIIACLPPIPRALSVRFPKVFWWMSEKERSKRSKSTSSQDSTAIMMSPPVFKTPVSTYSLHTSDESEVV